MYKVIFKCEYCPDEQTYDVQKSNEFYGSELIGKPLTAMDRTACKSCAQVLGNLNEKIIEKLKGGEKFQDILKKLE